MVRARRLAILVAMAMVAALPARGADDDAVPASLAPFEHLIGGWKGQGIPQANRLRGWNERHLWAWKFEKGVPVALAVEFQGDKTIAKATLRPVKKAYALEGTGPDGKPVTFSGTLDPKGQTLTLDRQGEGASRERLTLRLNSNKIRYLLTLETRPADSPQFSKAIEVNLGKEGESFAAGGAAENVEKCILTGGAATMSVSYKGKSYPVCCTGCRDEFEANPEKWIAKAAAREQAAGKKGEAKPAPARSKSDDAFDDVLGDSPKTKGKSGKK